MNFSRGPGPPGVHGSGCGKEKSDPIGKIKTASWARSREALATNFFSRRSPMEQIDFIQALNKSTKRDYVGRVTEFPKA
jgi:hypothetical protein